METSKRTRTKVVSCTTAVFFLLCPFMSAGVASVVELVHTIVDHHLPHLVVVELVWLGLNPLLNVANPSPADMLYCVFSALVTLVFRKEVK